MFELDISEVARQAGPPASTLRDDEERGLIASSGAVRLASSPLACSSSWR